MSDDIVARLRAGGYHLTEKSTHLQAADEIERLRAENERLRLRAENERLRAENERLRAALRFYADPEKHTDCHGDNVIVPDFYSEIGFGERARAALEGKAP